MIFGPLEFWYPREKRIPLGAPKFKFDDEVYGSIFNWSQEDYELERQWKYEAWKRQNTSKQESYHYKPDWDDNKDIIDDPIPVGVIGYADITYSLSDAIKDFKDEKKKRKPITKQIKIRLVQQRGGLCESCREEIFQQVHHIDRDPSNNEDTNLMLVCYDCHKEMERRRF